MCTFCSLSLSIWYILVSTFFIHKRIKTKYYNASSKSCGTCSKLKILRGASGWCLFWKGLIFLQYCFFPILEQEKYDHFEQSNIVYICVYVIYNIYIYIYVCILHIHSYTYIYIYICTILYIYMYYIVHFSYI